MLGRELKLDNTKSDTMCFFFFTFSYKPMIKFNLRVRHNKRVIVNNDKGQGYNLVAECLPVLQTNKKQSQG